VANPTVKSLDERINDMVDTVISIDDRVRKVEVDLRQLSDRVEKLESRIDRLETAIEKLTTSVEKLTTSVEKLQHEFIEFKARIETFLSVGRWVAGIAGASFLTVVILVVNVAHTAGGIQSDVRTQSDRIGKLTDTTDRHEKELQLLRSDLAEIKALLKARP
jgi:cell division protein FtsB